MGYVHLSISNAIDSTEVGQPVDLQLRDGSGTRLWSPYITETELNACGWFTVVSVARPSDTQTQTTDRSLTVVAGKPTETWTIRAKTQAELDSDRDAANRATIQQQATTALDNNRTYLAIGSPSAAQVAAQVRALTQQNNGVIRLVLGKLDGTN